MDKRERAKITELGESFRTIFGVEVLPELFQDMLTKIDEKTRDGVGNGRRLDNTR
jgi:hypothetical protein